MTRANVYALVITCLSLIFGPMTPIAVGAVPSTAPNIVVFYVDDVSAMAGANPKLWEDPKISPTVKSLFVDHGVEFTNAIGETSLCCPARGSLLTGQHTHNHGVFVNDARLFNPSMHIGKALKNAGYSTMFIGKYLNMVNAYSPTDWTRDGEGWTYLDVINGRNGDYVKYWLHTKTGSIFYKTHSTRMVVDRAVMRFREVPDDQPLFAVLSIYNMHGPNKPLAEFANDARCNGYPPYKPPNYNEADVSDKPPLIQALPLLPYVNGWPTIKYCREMLGIDWAVKSVTDELQAEGRLDNTLLVFTADNGMAWGIHRAAQRKTLPYTTPVALYLRYPDRWGNSPRKVDRIVSNIDLAPTFCALAGTGCHLGPYPGGQDDPDGKNMLPLVDNSSTTWRNAAIEESTGWRGLRTDPTHPLGPWHYVEWANGFRELYDLRPESQGGDPWEMENAASDPSTAAVRNALAAQLESLWQANRTDSPDLRPDAMIGGSKNGVYFGSHVYASSASTTQMFRYTGAPSTSTRSFWVEALNRSPDPASYTVTATSTGSATISVRYLYNGADVTSAVTGAGYRLPDVPLASFASFQVKMNATSALDNDQRTAFITVTRTGDSSRVDVVKAIMTR